MPGRILIADDRFASRLMLAALFGGAYYDVLQADRADRALDIAGQEQPGAIVISDNLAGMGSLALCDALHGLPDCAHSLRVVLTDRPDPARAATLIAAGADDVICRTSSDQEILARLRRLFEHRARIADLTMQGIATPRPAGLAEAAAEFDAPIRVAIFSAAPHAADWAQAIGTGPGGTRFARPLLAATGAMVPDRADVVVLDGDSLGRDAALRMTATMLRRGQGPVPEVLVATDGRDPALAVQALDLGAGGILPLPFDTAEAQARIALLHRRRQDIVALQDRLRSGLESAVTDPLTGLYNRRYALPRIEQVVRDVRATGRMAAVLMADLDHFKWVNDTHGHPAGDAVLQGVARILSAGVEGHGFAARIGGEEFVIVLPDSTPHAARAIAQRLRAAVAGASLPAPAHAQGLQVTVSIGLANVDARLMQPFIGPPEEASRVLARADHALYRAKKAGRNRVMAEEPPQPPHPREARAPRAMRA